jgi:hypothetical protein
MPTLHKLSIVQLDEADQRFPKWSTMCRLRSLGLPVLNAVLITPDQGPEIVAEAVETLAGETRQRRLMLRSDGGAETGRYYRGGNSFPLGLLPERISALLSQGRAVILLEPTNRFNNRLTAVLRMERPAPGESGQFTIEALGPGYDVADLTRGGIIPQVTVTAPDIDWVRYREAWWSDLRLSQEQSQSTEQSRRLRRLAQLANHVLSDTGLLDAKLLSADQARAVETWLRQHGYTELWENQDIAPLIARRARAWLDDAFMIARNHPNRAWTCLATATSDLGHGRWVFWDVVDGNRKYAL